MRRIVYLSLGLLLLGLGLAKAEILHLGWPPRLASAEAVPSEVSFIHPEDLKRRLDLGEEILVGDVRRRDSYDKLHLAGAVSLPMDDHSTWGPKLLEDQWLVLYCACESDESSAQAAREIQKVYGHSRVMVLRGGLGGWVEAGYPIVERKLPASLQRVKVP